MNYQYRESTFSLTLIAFAYVLFLVILLMLEIPTLIAAGVTLTLFLLRMIASELKIDVDTEFLTIKVCVGLIKRKIPLKDIVSFKINENPIKTVLFDPFRQFNVLYMKNRGICYGINCWNPQLTLVLQNKRVITLFLQEPRQLRNAIWQARSEQPIELVKTDVT